MSVQDIQPEQLIDTSENKPLEQEPEQIPEQTTTQNVGTSSTKEHQPINTRGKIDNYKQCEKWH